MTNRSFPRHRPIAAVILAATLLSSACSPSLGRLLARNGYCELRPPSTLLPPGTVVVLRQKSPLIVDIVCTAGESLGADFVPLSSPSAEVVEQLQRARSFRLDAGSLPAGEAAASAQFIQRVDLRLKDVTILTLSDASVLRQAPQRDPACQRAIDAALAAGAEMAMVREVIRASVEYTVRFRADAGLDADARLRIVRGLAPSLHVDGSTATTSTVQGDALFWGAVEDRRLVRLDAAGATSVERLVGPVPMRVGSPEPTP